MFCGGGFELSLVFRACFVGALLDRGLGPPARTVAGLVFRACFAGVLPTPSVLLADSYKTPKLLLTDS